MAQQVEESYQNKITNAVTGTGSALTSAGSAIARNRDATLQWQADMLGVGAAAQSAAAAVDSAAAAAYNAKNPSSDMPGANPNGGTFNPDVMNASPGSFSGSPFGGAHFNGGGTGMRLDIGILNPDFDGSTGLMTDQSAAPFKRPTPDSSASNLANGALRSGGGLDAAIQAAKHSYPADYGTMQSLYDLKNAQTNDNAVKEANLQAEMAWLQAQPETIARDQQIVTLTQSINQLTTATNANTASLNPLYTQGAGALAIGYYHAATGLEGVVGGSGGTDSQAFHAMLTPGEHVKITPPGQSGTKQSAGSGGTPVVNNVFNIGSGTTNNSRRNARQVAQGYAQSIAAASR